MKLEGAPIAYDKVTQTYYYTLDGEFSCTFGWEVNWSDASCEYTDSNIIRV